MFRHLQVEGVGVSQTAHCVEQGIPRHPLPAQKVRHDSLAVRFLLHALHLQEEAKSASTIPRAKNVLKTGAMALSERF